MQKILSILRLNDESLVLEKRIFILICTILIFGNSLALLSNILLGLSRKLDILLLLSVIVFSFFLFFSIKKQVSDNTRVWFVLGGFTFFIPGWYFNGGSEGSTPFYLVFFICGGMLSLPKRMHLNAAISFLLVYIMLLVSEHLFPKLVTPYPNPESRHLDFIVSGIWVSVVMITLIIFFKNIYESNLQNLKKSNQLLKNSRIQLLSLKRKAEAATNAKSYFLANMSHEIRTPLNGIRGTAELLKQTPLSREQLDYIKILESSSELLMNIINDVLDISKIEAEKLSLSLKPFDLHHCLQNVVNICTPQIKIQQKDIQLHLVIDESLVQYVEGDEGRLSQILLNLTGNAIKFTSKGQIVITVSAQEMNDQEQLISFSISDTGIGIAPKYFQQLFLPFSQVHMNATRQYGGTGLGLSICKRLVELMGGTIQAESEEGKGSVFAFTIPLKTAVKCENNYSSALLGDENNFDPVTILLAEDNKMNQMIIRKMFEHIGISIEIADNGLEAVTKAMNKHYDLIFMDIQMPEMDGIEATGKILKHCASSQKQEPVIIAMTANAFDENKKECLEAGMKDFVTKPVSMQQLKSFITKWTQKEELLAI